MSKLFDGQGAGGTPNDKGAQGGSDRAKMSDKSLESGMKAQAEKFAAGSQKEQGYVDVKGTM